ncbi:hypothetical protein GN244_ATG16436 [Phytophthora infestans]|uniref:Secreted RxLR effector peptide protein n=1 Tax=Phytophthora infestans TaxID=4787 RepID=A0A833SAU0_PHYIN|nr:hypothetical protein GN244_ATG16436 [Phytophthora infestans]
MALPMILVLLLVVVVVDVAPDVEPVAASHEPVGSKAEVIVAGTESAGTTTQAQLAESRRQNVLIVGWPVALETLLLLLWVLVPVVAFSLAIFTD